MGKIQSSENQSRRQVIITKAATLFKEKGFKAASMRELADEVGVEAASLYNHIHSKSELLHIICIDVANRYSQKMEEVESIKITCLQKIEILLRFHITGMVLQYDEVHVSDREWKHLEDPYLSNYQNQRRTYRKRFAAIIQEGIAKKEIKNIDAATCVLILLHAVSGIESWHRSKEKINGKELEESMIAILVGGLKR